MKTVLAALVLIALPLAGQAATLDIKTGAWEVTTTTAMSGMPMPKEALAKALGAPAGLAWHDAEVVTLDDGRPWFEVRGSVAQRCQHLGVARIHLSLSHDAGIASAVVVLEAAGA